MNKMPIVMQAVAEELERLAEGLCCGSVLLARARQLRTEVGDAYRMDHEFGPGYSSITRVDMTGKVVVIRGGYELKQETIDAFGAAVKAAGAFLVILSPGMSLEALDDDVMASYGWVRK